jgi:hypothetical protein
VNVREHKNLKNCKSLSITTATLLARVHAHFKRSLLRGLAPPSPRTLSALAPLSPLSPLSLYVITVDTVTTTTHHCHHRYHYSIFRPADFAGRGRKIKVFAVLSDFFSHFGSKSKSKFLNFDNFKLRNRLLIITFGELWEFSIPPLPVCSMRSFGILPPPHPFAERNLFHLSRSSLITAHNSLSRDICKYRVSHKCAIFLSEIYVGLSEKGRRLAWISQDYLA